MVRVSLKNTFLSFDEGDDSELAHAQKSASPRSRSAEVQGSPPRKPEELTEMQLTRLLDMNLQRLPPSVGSRPQSPQSSSPRALSPRQLAEQRKRAMSDEQAAAASSSSPNASEAGSWLQAGMNQTDSMQGDQQLPARRGQIQSQLRYVASNGSLVSFTSGMSDQDGSPRQMPHAWSSNSVSSLASDYVDNVEHAPGMVEFDLAIEEGETLRPTEETYVGPGGAIDNGTGVALQGRAGESCAMMPVPEFAQGPFMMVTQMNMQQDAMCSPQGSVSPDSKERCGQGDARQAQQQNRNLPKEYRHGRVPKNFDLAEEYRTAAQERPATTLMIRNIPNRYTQRELILELEALGFAGTFDFLYAPLDKGTMSNVGYAFVNFIDHTWAAKCMESFHGYRFKRHRKASGKIAAVSIAHIQGLEANLAHYKNAAVNTAKLKQRRPLVMANISNSLLGALGVDEDEVAERI